MAGPRVFGLFSSRKAAYAGAEYVIDACRPVARQAKQPTRIFLDAHRASLLTLTPTFAAETELAAQGCHLGRWSRRWSTRLFFQPASGEWWKSVYYGDGLLEVRRDPAEAQDGMEEVHSPAEAMAEAFPLGRPVRFQGRGAGQGRPRLALSSEFQAYDAVLVILVKILSVSWNEARKWVQRERARALLQALPRGATRKKLAGPWKITGAYKRHVALVRAMLRPRHVPWPSSAQPGPVRGVAPGTYVDRGLKLPTRWDREHVGRLTGVADYQASGASAPWANAKAVGARAAAMLATALRLVAARRSPLPPPRLTEDALQVLTAVAGSGSWVGHWPLETRLPAGLGAHLFE